MVGALFDTNILIDYLQGIAAAKTEYDRYDDRAISVITFMEVLVGAPASAEAGTRAFLNSFVLVALDNIVAERAIATRKQHRVKLPDAVVWASAHVQGRLLVTRNTKDYPVADPSIRVPYKI